MLTPEQLAHCADDIVNLYSKLNEEIVRDVARCLAKASDMTATGRLQILALQDVGMLTDDILRSISKYSGMSENLLFDLFEDAGIMSVEYDMEIYRANGLNPLPLNMSPAAMQVLEAGYKKTNGNLQNLTGTTAQTSQTNFINACTLAELKAESGAFSPEQAIADAVKQLAKDGAFVLYPSGHRDKLDVAIRRNVMTGIGQTTGEICLGYARELGWDLMEITAHAGARPSHSAWQGQIVSLSGQRGYLSLNDIGYGTVDGYKGAGCRHDMYPCSKGSKRMYSAEDLAKLNAKDIEFPDGSMHTLYEAEQYQRAYERKIRETKRILAAQDEFIKNTSSASMKSAMQRDFDERAIVLKRQEAQMKAFCDKTGLLVDNARTQKYGFGRSTAQRARGSANRHYNSWSKEHNINNIKTLADYYDVKYNDTKRYELLKRYTRSIDTGMLSPMTSFEIYEKYYNRVQIEIVGLTTSSGIEIKSQSIHFLERVFGTKEDPSHDNKIRSGVSLDDIKDALLNGQTRVTHGGQSILHYTDKCGITVNPHTGNLIQVNPR